VKKVLIVLTGLAMLFGLMATPASAATVDLGHGWTQVTPYGAAMRTQYECPANKICTWNDAYGWGARCEWFVSSIRGGTPLPSACANKVSSSFNRTTYHVVWFDGANCDANLAVREDTGNYYQANWGTRSFDNRISSVASRANWSGEYC
jgi:peptidase inhibitor family I36